MRPAFLAVTALSLIATAGCARHYALVGFPDRDEIEDLAEVAALLDRDVDAVRTAIDARHAGHDPETWRTREALHTLFTAQLAIANEHTDYFDPAQEVELRRPPIQRFPRLTAPAVAEPVRGPDGDATWFVPVIFTASALYWSDSFESTWFGWSADEDGDTSELISRWLVPFGDHAAEEMAAIDITPYVMRFDRLDVPLESGHAYRLPSPRDDSDAIVFALPADSEIAPGYYGIRVMPRVQIPRLETPILEAAAQEVRDGDWWSVAEILASVERSELDLLEPTVIRDFRRAASAAETFAPSWWDDELADLVQALEQLARPADRGPRSRSVGPMLAAVRRLVEVDPHPTPVLLDPPGASDQPFSIVVSGDFQYGGDMSAVRRFLRMISPGHARRSEGMPDVPVPPRLREKLDDVRFVVIAGDLADGEGLSSSPGRVVLHGLGALPPASPYEDEFAHLRDELRKFDVPFFATPGNHDAFASFGGVLNDAAMIGSEVLEDWVPDPIGYVTHPVGEGLYWLAQRIPLLVKVGRMFEDPFFDGLVEYQHYLGPLNFAFRYRGQGFIGLNSANLTVNERDQVGALAENWGGSLYPADVVWFDLMSRRLRKAAMEDACAASQFVFLHHDPRAIIPVRGEDGVEEVFVGYDQSDALFNMLTFGYLGIEHSPNTPMFIPVISPIGSYLPRYVAQGERFDQEWMGEGLPMDANEGRAEEIIRAINSNLAGGENDADGIDHLFFAHNDIPHISSWSSQDPDGYVFPRPNEREWSGHKFGSKSALAPFFKLRTVRPPDWGQGMTLTDGRDATVVRVDDVGQAGEVHGFHLLTIDPRGFGDERVRIEWFEIPAPDAPGETAR